MSVLIYKPPEFDDLAREVSGTGILPAVAGTAGKMPAPPFGVTEPAARAALREELDGLIAHLYGLTDDEFAYILTTFPLVAQPVKDAALGAFRTFAHKPGDPAIAALLTAGESAKVRKWNSNPPPAGTCAITRRTR